VVAYIILPGYRKNLFGGCIYNAASKQETHVWRLHIQYCQHTGDTCLVAAYTILPAYRKHLFGGCIYNTASIQETPVW